MKPRLAVFSLALAALLASTCLREVRATPQSPALLATSQEDSTFDITEGPTAGTYEFSGGAARGVLIQGRITPALPAGTTGGISGATATCSEGEIVLSSNCWMGGANGASFTGYIKTGAGCLGTSCTQVKLTFTLDNSTSDEYCVTLRNPTASAYVAISSTVTRLSPNLDTIIPLSILGSNGQLNSTFTGDVTVIPGSLRGTGVLIGGSAGMTTVHFEDGLGSMTVRAVSGVPRDTLTFDFLCGGRLSPRRDSIDVW